MVTTSTKEPTWFSKIQIVGLRLYQVVSHVLFDPLELFRHLIELPAYFANLLRYASRQKEASPSFRLRVRHLFPAPGDRRDFAGVTKGHYFHQDLHVARQIYNRNPARHVDVGSSTSGFIAHLLSFREVDYVDIRPLNTQIDGLNFIEGSMLALPFEDQSIGSLSALHSPEHVGLGRYGDPIDPNAWQKVIEEFQRVLMPGGVLYFSVPVGPERLEFDAHRVFAPSTILEEFDQLQLTSFSFVDDAGDFFPNRSPHEFQGWYGCGIFQFER